MLIPLYKTQPTELIATGALHAIAALILLNWLLAARTSLCMYHDPGHILGFRFVLLFPVFDNGAGGGEVLFIPTAETKHLSTLTSDDLRQRASYRFHSILAAWIRTPAHEFV